MPAKMIYTCSGGEERECNTHPLVSGNAKDIVGHFSHGGTTAGFSISYAVNPCRNEVIEIFKKGKLVQRDIKPLIEEGFCEWHYDWAFATKDWRNESGEKMKFSKLDLTKVSDILPWYRALYR